MSNKNKPQVDVSVLIADLTDNYTRSTSMSRLKVEVDKSAGPAQFAFSFGRNPLTDFTISPTERIAIAAQHLGDDVLEHHAPKGYEHVSALNEELKSLISFSNTVDADFDRIKAINNALRVVAGGLEKIVFDKAFDSTNSVPERDRVFESLLTAKDVLGYDICQSCFMDDTDRAEQLFDFFDDKGSLPVMMRIRLDELLDKDDKDFANPIDKFIAVDGEVFSLGNALEEMYLDDFDFERQCKALDCHHVMVELFEKTKPALDAVLNASIECCRAMDNVGLAITHADVSGEFSGLVGEGGLLPKGSMSQPFGTCADKLSSATRLATPTVYIYAFDAATGHTVCVGISDHSSPELVNNGPCVAHLNYYKELIVRSNGDYSKSAITDFHDFVGGLVNKPNDLTLG